MMNAFNVLLPEIKTRTGCRISLGFAATAHDLIGRLGCIEGFAKLMLRTTEDARQRFYLSAIAASSRSAAAALKEVTESAAAQARLDFECSASPEERI